MQNRIAWWLVKEAAHLLHVADILLIHLGTVPLKQAESLLQCTL